MEEQAEGWIDEIGAVVIFAVIVAAAIATEAFGWVNFSKALLHFGSTIFEVVVGFLGGESAVSRT